MRMNDLEIPTIPTVSPETHTCGGKTCQAVRHIEDVAADLEELRREVRQTERHHSEDMRKLWYKIGALVAAVAALVPTGWGVFLGLVG